MTQRTVRPRTLPAELITRILDYLELHYLFAPLATCRDWRRVALDHPTYWRSIRLASTSDGAIDLFLARMFHARKRKFNVCIEAPSSCARISNEVLPAIAFLFDYLVDFAATVHHDQVSDLFHVLKRPAPALKCFQIFVITPRRARLVVLPVDVFSGQAPNLTFVGFCDTVVSNAAYPAFSSVTRVSFGFTRAETFHVVPVLFSVFHHMRRFALYSGNIDVPEDFNFPHSLPSEMATVECVMNPESFDVMVGVLPYHIIPTVRVSGIADDTVDFFTAHIAGDLTMEIVDRRTRFPELFDITLTSLDTGFTRIFGQSARRYLAGVKPAIAFLRDAAFAERLVALTIPNVLWGFITPHLLPLPNLETLTIRLDSPTLHVLGAKWSVSCTKLRTLRLAANTVDPLYVSTERLAAFVAIALADLPSTARPALELDSVILEGDIAVLKPHVRIPGEVDGPSRTIQPRTLSSPVVSHSYTVK